MVAAVGVAVVVMAVVVIIVVVFDLHCASDARAWTRKAPLYVPCAGAVCGVFS